MVTLELIQKRLAEAIRQSGLSQSEIARNLNVRQQTISCYLHSKKMPALDTFSNLCAVLDADAAYILGLEDETGAKTYISNSFNNFNNSGTFKL